jgi:HD-GYP domain-containing protein (c-di-GMP phosphodiesterase class II)
MDSQVDRGASNLKKTPVENLILGMYVAGLDKPWLDTPFAMQGFYLRSDAAISRVREICDDVYVDPRRYDSSLVDLRHAKVQSTTKKLPPPTRRRDRKAVGLTPRRRFCYPEEVELKDEIEPARVALEHAIEEVDVCLCNLVDTGELDTGAIEGALKPLIASVVRNKDAATALVRMKRFDDYLYAHAISCAVWAAVLGRELGYPPSDVERVSYGCALMDIGKTRLPRELLEQTAPPSDDELDLMKRHVDFGLELITKSGLCDEATINIVKTHHERFDGSGYPNGLTNAEIPIFGRIAGLVDSYDAMISPRAYAPSRASYQVLLELERNADQLFQKELVEYFIHAVGIFPVGAVVELNTGEVGIIVKQHADRRLRPKILLILDENKLPRTELSVADLGLEDDNGGAMTTWITRELPKDSHGIDVSRYFL